MLKLLLIFNAYFLAKYFFCNFHLGYLSRNKKANHYSDEQVVSFRLAKTYLHPRKIHPLKKRIYPSTLANQVL